MDLAELDRVIASEPLWYERVFERGAAGVGEAVLRAVRDDRDSVGEGWPQGRVSPREASFLYFERRFLQRRVLLAEQPAVEYDALRVPIDRVVVHHTSRPPGIRPALSPRCTWSGCSFPCG